MTNQELTDAIWSLPGDKLMRLEEAASKLLDDDVGVAQQALMEFREEASRLLSGKREEKQAA